MTDTNYQPPAAPVAEVQNIDAEPFYMVAPFKFMLLFLSTWGLYGIYWFYRHWRQLRNVRGRKVWPVPRSVFAIFFTHSLFAEIDRELGRNGHRYEWSANGQATFYVVLVIGGYILDRVTDDSGWAILLSIVTLILPMLPLLKAQKAANTALGDADGEVNRELTLANIAWIAVGSLLWLLTLVVAVMLVVDPSVLE